MSYHHCASPWPWPLKYTLEFRPRRRGAVSINKAQEYTDKDHRACRLGAAREALFQAVFAQGASMKSILIRALIALLFSVSVAFAADPLATGRTSSATINPPSLPIRLIFRC